MSDFTKAQNEYFRKKIKQVPGTNAGTYIRYLQNTIKMEMKFKDYARSAVNDLYSALLCLSNSMESTDPERQMQAWSMAQAELKRHHDLYQRLLVLDEINHD